MTTLQVLVPTTQNIEHEGNIVVRSHLKGNIHCEGALIVEVDASVHGEVHVASAQIFGTVKGFLEVRERVIFTDNSYFEGILDATSLVCSAKTTLIGEIRVTPNKR